MIWGSEHHNKQWLPPACLSGALKSMRTTTLQYQEKDDIAGLVICAVDHVITESYYFIPYDTICSFLLYDSVCSTKKDFILW